MPKLTPQEREDFLNVRKVICNIATVDESGAPLVTPIWFICEENRIWFTPRQHSEWLKHIRNDQRIALSIDEPDLPYRKVVVRGNERIDFEVGNDNDWRDRYRRIAMRYLDDVDANGYVDGTDDQPRALCSIGMEDSQVRSWRMPTDEEPYQGIWAKRYWTDEAKVSDTAPKLFE